MRRLVPSTRNSHPSLQLHHHRPNPTLTVCCHNNPLSCMLFSTNAPNDNDSNTNNNRKNNKPRVLILGSGWAGFTLARQLQKSHYDVRLVSPANHFLFTPLLPSTAVGTLEFRAIQEPVRTIQGLGKYYQAKATLTLTKPMTI